MFLIKEFKVIYGMFTCVLITRTSNENNCPLCEVFILVAVNVSDLAPTKRLRFV